MKTVEATKKSDAINPLEELHSFDEHSRQSCGCAPFAASTHVWLLLPRFATQPRRTWVAVPTIHEQISSKQILSFHRILKFTLNVNSEAAEMRSEFFNGFSTSANFVWCWSECWHIRIYSWWHIGHRWWKSWWSCRNLPGNLKNLENFLKLFSTYFAAWSVTGWWGQDWTCWRSDRCNRGSWTWTRLRLLRWGHRYCLISWFWNLLCKILKLFSNFNF